MIKYKVSHFLLALLLTFNTLFGCKNTEPKYEPAPGQPNLSLITGHWKGTVLGIDGYGSPYTDDCEYIGTLEMNGEKAGQMDIVYFNDLNSEGEPIVEGWQSKLYHTPSTITYLTNDYTLSDWVQTDSFNFTWNLTGKQYFDDKVGDYRDFVTFKREQDSLSIITGRVLLSDSTYNIQTKYTYGKIKN
jgi:hypothetical protein